MTPSPSLVCVQALLVVAALYFARFDASFLSLRAKSIMAKSALPMLTLTNTIFQVCGGCGGKGLALASTG